jgi:cytochrome P450
MKPNDDAVELAQFESDLQHLPIDRIDVAQPRLFQLGMAPRYLERLRREAPVHYCSGGHFGSYWSVTRFRDVESVEFDTEAYSSDHFAGGIAIGSSPNQRHNAPSFIAMDPPRHAQRRRGVAPAFGQRRIAALAVQVRRWCEDILDNVPIGEPFDWVDRVSIELTGRTLALLLDYPQQQARELIRWSDAMMALPGGPMFKTMDEKLLVMRESFDMFDAIWRERSTRAKDDDLISMLLQISDLDEEGRTEFHGNMQLMIVGGNDTTRNSISGSVVALDRFPDEMHKLRGNPELIRNFASEVVRWQTPVAHMRRTATRDIELGGRTIAEGDKVILWYLSANRDEGVFDRGDDFQIERSNARRHLSFGAGVHRCLGARIAELQVQILWEEVLKRFPGVDVVGSPERTYSTFMHGFSKLLVSIPSRLSSER